MIIESMKQQNQQLQKFHPIYRNRISFLKHYKDYVIHKNYFEMNLAKIVNYLSESIETMFRESKNFFAFT